MKLRVIGSGSSGNTYLLSGENETLVLDCGVRFMEVKKALNFNIRGIVGALVTHAHGDHAKYAHEYEEAGITVWKPYEELAIHGRNDAQFGGFRVQSFGVIHNVPCTGFLIGHKDLGKMLYVTDTEYLRYTFRNLSTILIEMNYSDEYVDRNAVKFSHVKQGHMEKQTALDCIAANLNDTLRHVILCHLSQDGSDPAEFKRATQAIVPPDVTVDVAVAGLVVELGVVPF